MTQKEFLIDTINHYNSSNRCSHQDGDCCYSPFTAGLEGKSEGCAIGRFMEPEVALEMDNKHDLMNIRTLLNHEPDCISDWMKEFDIDFLTAIQNLHDADVYWNKQGLSELGHEEVLKICKKFGIEL